MADYDDSRDLDRFPEIGKNAPDLAKKFFGMSLFEIQSPPENVVLESPPSRNRRGRDL